MGNLMAELHILNTKETKEFKKEILDQWGVEFDDLFFVLRHPNGRTYIVNREIEEIDLSKLKISNIGLYFATWDDRGFRLSIEGSQMIGPKAKKNIIELDSKQAGEWLLGQEPELTEKQKAGCTGFLIVKNKTDYMGCGKIAGNNLMNFVPKTRRIGSVIE
ncbi:hypothetical protein KY340_04510 [Candidatus Woesearchaeota archaeon]|nr:hypothetical protein [Candidatus Woesearchaeota archaeon]